MGRRWGTTLALGLSLVSTEFMGCGAKSVECDGFICPAGLVCDNDNSRCLQEGQQEACLNLEEGADCIFNANGVCDKNACIVATCGDSAVEPGEMCDDGNQVSGDGCSDDCKTNEQCGNGVFDFLQGEACEDSNLLSHDRCSSSCQEELPAWASPETFPLGQTPDLAMVYDPKLNHFVLIGPDSSGASRLWYGDEDQGWLLGPAIPPTMRSPFYLAFDENLGATIVVGVDLNDRSVTETWTLDNNGWSQLQADPPLPAFVSVSPTYDTERQNIVAVIADDDFDYYDEDEYDEDAHTVAVYVLDGAAWRVLSTSGAPPSVRGGIRTVYDKREQRVVLVGGFDFVKDEHLADTWYLSSSNDTWTRGPSLDVASTNHTLAYNDKAERIELLGGQNSDGRNKDLWYLVDDVWEKGTALPDAFSARSGHVAAYDPDQDRVVVMLGRSNGGLLNDIWRRDNSDSWLDVSNPTPNDGAAGDLAAYDSDEGFILRFHNHFSSPLGTFFWNGSLWQNIPGLLPPPGPYSATFAASLAYDPGEKRMVLAVPPQTYFLEDAGWVEQTDIGQLPPAAVSPELKKSKLVYDTDEEQLVFVLYTRVEVGGDETMETWTRPLDGVWTQRTGSQPPPQINFSLAYFPPLEGTLLVGNSTLETWLFSNNQWQNLNAPITNQFTDMAYDERIGQMILVGKTATNGTDAETKLFNGLAWNIQQTLGETTGGGRPRPLVYDQRRGQIVRIENRETILFSYTDGGREEFCGDDGDADGDGLAGCADPDCYGFCDPGCDPTMMSCPR